MGLDTALTTAVSSLKATQDALAITSQNIANANSENYIRREVVQTTQVVDGVAAGVQVSEVRRAIDDFLVNSARDQRASVGDATVRSEFFERIDLFYGAPGQDNSLNVYTDNFFSTLSDLATTPEQAAVRNIALSQGTTLANSVQELASNLEDIRLLADQELANSINELNTKLEAAFNINVAIQETTLSGGDSTSLLDTRDALVSEISEFLDVTVNYDLDGSVSIAVSSGEILSTTSLSRISYSQLPSVDSLINSDVISQISSTVVDVDGNLTSQSLVLKSASNVSQPIDNINSGRLGGLIALRDTDVPALIAQLDEFAQTLQDAFNAIHNDGVGFPPASDLTGTTAVTSTDDHNFSGKLRIAVLNTDGSPVPDPYGASVGYPPLTIDLDALNGGSGAGTATVQDIIEEINEYYGPPSAFSAAVGDLDNIKIASVSSTVNSSQATEDITIAGVPTAAVLSVGDFDFSNVGNDILAGDTITVGVNVFTFKDDGLSSVGTNIEIQATEALTIAEIATYLNNTVSQSVFADAGKFFYTASTNGLSVTSRTTGIANNAIGLAASNVNVTATDTAGGTAAAGETLTINGQVFTFVTASGFYDNFDNFIEVGADATTTAANVASALNASTNTSVSTAAYSSALGVVTVTHDQGTAGNSFTLAEASGVVSVGAATLSGGGIARGTYEFDFEFFNQSGSAVTFDVTSITVDNGGVYAGAALPGDFTDYTAAAGERVRTSDSIVVDFSASTVAIGGTHNITAGVQVTDAEGNVSNETITFAFIVPDTNVDVRNDRSDATAIGGADGTLTNVVNSNRFLTAQIVNASGTPVAQGESGFLRIFSNQGDVGFGIDELDSNEGGFVADPLNTVTNKGVSHFFGLNDFFVSNAGLKNTAVNFDIREDIKTNSGGISTGELLLSSQPSDSTLDPNYTYEVGAGSNQVVTRLADMRFERSSFDSAGGLPDIVVSFSGYAAEILNFVALTSNNASNSLSQETTLLSAFTDRIEAIGGVNIDEELANTIVYQNNFSASARIINIISELFDTLIKSF